MHIIFKNHNYMLKSTFYIFSLVSSFILKKKGITIDCCLVDMMKVMHQQVNPSKSTD